MRILISLFIVTFVISLVALAYLFGQRSVDVSLASLTLNSNSSSCLKNNKESQVENTISFNLDGTLSGKLDKSKVMALASVEDDKEAIDTTVIHAIRMGEWTDKDNLVFLHYIAGLDKKERISVLKQMNTAINYQQMKVGSYLPNF